MTANSRKKKMLIDPAELKARGHRVKQLRKLLHYSSARAFGEQYGITNSTFKSWEQGRHTGLTTNGALKIIEACKQEGLHCTLDWLLHGIGEAPTRRDFMVSTNQHPAETIEQEIHLFHTLHQDAIDVAIDDDVMQPYFFKGDRVAGIQYRERNIDQLVGLNCIVQLENGNTLVRQLLAGQKTGFYTLNCTNPAALKNATQYNVRLLSAAYVVWIRKPDPLKSADHHEE